MIMLLDREGCSSSTEDGQLLHDHHPVPKSEIMAETQFLSHLLRHEFVYKPARKFDDNFDETLDFMIHTERILSDEWNDGAHNVLRINEGSSETVWFLAMLIWPFLDIYWIIALSLRELLP